MSASSSADGPTLVVTVPDLLPGGSPGSATASSPATSAEPPTAAPTSEAAAAPATQSEQAAPSAAPEAESPAATTAAAPVDTTAAAAEPPPAAPAGAGLNVSLANCEGCMVLATHRDVTGDLSAALVGTGARAILLSVAADGGARGVIGVPYGAAFPAPEGGVLACAAGTCVVEGRQPDGRAILSAFELTDTGAWRDVSGDDAFPSATENGAVVDAGDRLAIAVQDQAEGAAVWVLYAWDGTRYSVVGCAADGPAPASADGVSPDACLS
ncbi:hypothetical protein ACVBEQ_00910 [Nakamurella sp. GG22]